MASYIFVALLFYAVCGVIFIVMGMNSAIIAGVIVSVLLVGRWVGDGLMLLTQNFKDKEGNKLTKWL